MVQPPSLTAVIAVVIGIAATGVTLDKLVLSSRLDIWRRKVEELWIKLNTPGAQGLTQDANQLFCDLFDHIYGRRTFTRRRVLASILSSMIALAILTLILGYENTAWPIIIEGEEEVTLLLLLVPTLLNLIPDFFSLMETRLVLDWSKSRGPLGIVFLIILDLVLTSALFVIGLSLLVAIYFHFLEEVIWREILAKFPGVDWIIDPGSGLLFYLTTFVTSLFWIIFVLTFGLIWVFHRLSPLANAVYYQVGQSNRPAAALSAFLNAFIIIVYAIWKLANWAIIG